MRCAVFGCKSDNQSKNFDRKTAFFSFPRNEMRSKWIHSCCRSDKFNVENSRICSKHFKSDDFKKDLKHELLNLPESCLRLKLKPNSVPSQNLPKTTSTSKSDDDRKKRLEKRKELKKSKVLLDEVPGRCDHEVGGGGSGINLTLPDDNNKSFIKTCDVGVNTDPNTQQEDLITALKAQLATLEKEYEVLKKKEASMLNKLLSQNLS